MLGIRDDLQKFRNQFLSTFEPTQTVNDMWNETKLAINIAIDKHVPTKMSTSDLANRGSLPGVPESQVFKRRCRLEEFLTY